MNRIKLFEEYTRTVGFRYSEPTIEVMVQIPTLYNSVENDLVNGLVVDTIKKILSDENVKVKGVETLFDREYEHDGAQEGESPIREALYSVYILVYNEKEVETIVGKLADRLMNKYDVAVDYESIKVKEA